MKKTNIPTHFCMFGDDFTLICKEKSKVIYKRSRKGKTTGFEVHWAGKGRKVLRTLAKNEDFGIKGFYFQSETLARDFYGLL